MTRDELARLLWDAVWGCVCGSSRRWSRERVLHRGPILRGWWHVHRREAARRWRENNPEAYEAGWQRYNKKLAGKRRLKTLAARRRYTMHTYQQHPAEVARQLAKGRSVADIALRLEILMSAVQAIIDKHGLKGGKNGR